MREYQNADYRSIYTSEPFSVPTVGQCWLIIFIEDLQEANSEVPDELKWWTALFLVCPSLAGDKKIQAGLDLIGFKGKPTFENNAVALAEAGNRAILWESQSDDWEPDLNNAQCKAEWFMEDAKRLLPLLRAKTFGQTGYEQMQ